eukprot:6490532-Amphidinium_carterae.1
MHHYSCSQADVKKLKQAVSSTRKTRLAEIAVTVANTPYYQAKLEAYLRDAPCYTEYSHKVTDHKAALGSLSMGTQEGLDELKEVLKQFPIWAQKLRPVATKEVEALLAKQLKAFIQNALDESCQQMCEALGPVLGDAGIVLSMDSEIPELRASVAKVVQANKQASAAQGLLAKLQAFKDKVNDKDIPIEDRAQLLQECLNQAALVNPGAVQADVTEAFMATVFASIQLLIMAIRKEEKHLSLDLCCSWYRTLPNFLNHNYIKKLISCCELAEQIGKFKYEAESMTGAPYVAKLQSVLQLVMRLMSACGAVKAEHPQAEVAQAWVAQFSAFGEEVSHNLTVALEEACKKATHEVQGLMNAVKGTCVSAAEKWKETCKQKLDKVMTDAKEHILQVDVSVLAEQYDKLKEAIVTTS